MRNTIGRRIREARKALTLSQANLAKLIGVDQSTVALWETDKTIPRQDKVDDLARVLYLTPEFLHYGGADGHQTTRNTVPVIGYVGAGNTIHEFPGGVIQETPAPPAVPGEDTPVATAAVIVRGNSMWPVYRDGDILYYNDGHRMKPAEAIGAECVIQVEDGHKVVKRLMSGSKRGVYTLSSYNAPEMRDISVEWCAHIVWIRRNLNPQPD